MSKDLTVTTEVIQKNGLVMYNKYKQRKVQHLSRRITHLEKLLRRQ